VWWFEQEWEQTSREKSWVPGAIIHDERTSAWVISIEPSEGAGLCDGLCSVVDLQFPKNVAHVFFECGCGDAQAAGELLVGQASGSHAQDLELAGAQRLYRQMRKLRYCVWRRGRRRARRSKGRERRQEVIDGGPKR